jgi:predicted RNA-binding protein with PUA-like domain
VRYWLFQGNPARWRIHDYLRDHPREDFRDWDWSIARYRDAVRRRDGAVLWLSGPETSRGVYAIGAVTEEATERPSDSPYWADPADRRRDRWSVRMAFEHVLFGSPILARDLRADPRFARATILRMPRAGNPHELTRSEWLAILDQLPGRRPRALRPAARRGTLSTSARRAR